MKQPHTVGILRFASGGHHLADYHVFVKSRIVVTYSGLTFLDHDTGALTAGSNQRMHGKTNDMSPVTSHHEIKNGAA